MKIATFLLVKWLKLGKCGYNTRAGTIKACPSLGAGTIRERVLFKSG